MLALSRHYEATAEVIHFIWIATLHFVSLAMTEKIKIAHAVRHMAMTIFFAITKIFNSISFRDYSLLFIKNLLITKEISK